MIAYLVLENGITFQGELFGNPGEITGEIVFSTGMTGYLETITDPSYYGQIVLQTFPLVGNYGIISSDLEKDFISAKAYIVKYPCQNPSNFRCEEVLDTFFKSKRVVGLKGIDTRALTRILRENGSMNGKITLKPPTRADQEDARSYRIIDAVAAVSCKEPSVAGEGRYRVALMDFGVRKSVIDALTERDCQVHIFPHSATANDIMSINPHGILLSPGPGDPSDPANASIIETIGSLVDEEVPMFAIGIGHLFLAMAYGYKVKKMDLGHRGANQPVKDLISGRVYITSQNHGYIALMDSPSFINVNDGTCEGINYGNSFSVQFSPEGCGGPSDTAFVFDRFIDNMERMAIHAAG